MKNTFNFLLVVAIMVFVIGCSCGKTWDFGSSEPKSNTPTKTGEKQAGNSDKSLEDKAIDTVVGDESTGIPECDEMLEFFAKEAKNPDDDYITKATKQFVFNKIKETFKEDFEKNKDNKPQMAKNCKQYLDQLKNYKSQDTEKPK